MHVNNEIGVVQDIAAIGKCAVLVALSITLMQPRAWANADRSEPVES